MNRSGLSSLWDVPASIDRKGQKELLPGCHLHLVIVGKTVEATGSRDDSTAADGSRFRDPPPSIGGEKTQIGDLH